MRRLSRTLLPLLASAGLARAAPEAELVTVGPGDAVWERFGHNMIRLRDAAAGFDVCYNWGVFDFDRPGFIGNFVRGRMLYTMQAWRTTPVLEEYRRQNRRVLFQPLRLSPAELNALGSRCEVNSLPQNADYRYDYFKDNCSTRVRDMLDVSTGGRLRQAANAGRPLSPVVTYRSQAMRLMQDDFWVSLGADFALGPAVDRPLDAWANGFLPEQVVTLAGPVSGPAYEQWTSTRPPDPAAPPRRWPWLLGAGVVWGGLAAGPWRRPGTAAAVLWWTASGFGGLFMIYAWTTDHTAAYANQNLWHYAPMAWAVPALLVVRRRRVAARLAWLIFAVGLVGGALHVAGVLVQQNLPFILLALPANAGAATALTRRRRVDEATADADAPPRADSVAAGPAGLRPD